MDSEQYLEALLSLPGSYGATVSYDKQWVAWAWFRAAPAAEVYVAPVDGSSPPIRLTATPENTILVNWSPDSQSVIVTQDKNGNERRQLFRVMLDNPLQMLPLTEEDPNYFIRGGQLHPNNKWLIYGANLDVTTGQEIEQTVVIRHDLETGERLELARPKTSGWNLPRLSPNGEWIIYDTHDEHPAGVQQSIVSIHGEYDRQILNVGADKKVYGRWTNDSQSIVFSANTETYSRIGIIGLHDGDEIRWLIDDPDRNVYDVFVPHGSDYAVVTDTQDARSTYSLLDLETNEETPFPQLVGALNPKAPINSTEWVGSYNSSTQPTDIVRFSLDATSSDDLISISKIWERTDLTSDDLTPAEDFRWQSTDGLEIQGWLYRTQSDPVGTVVYVHGGPTSHSRDAINNQIQFFVKKGFNVLDPNYRGSTGFGVAFTEKIKEDGWGGMEQVDIEAGIKALIKQGIAEKGKVGITGTSYGGYSSWHAITHFPIETLKASAPICGMTDLVVDYETTRPDLRPYSEAMMGGSPDEVPEIYYERSPINFVQNIEGRLLIIQGMQDPNVHPDNVTEVRQQLDQAGVEYGVLPFDDEGHGIMKPKNQKILYKELANFFESAFTE